MQLNKAFTSYFCSAIISQNLQCISALSKHDINSLHFCLSARYNVIIKFQIGAIN